MTPHSLFSAWANFYTMIGSSSAALTGLVFVASTLVAARRESRPEGVAVSAGTSVFTSPVVVIFCSVFLISCIFAAPWPSPGFAGSLIGLTGLFGVLYVSRVIFRATRLEGYIADPEDWAWFMYLPLISYIVICASGFALVHIPVHASFALAAATVMLIFIGIRNAWDVITYLALNW